MLSFSSPPSADGVMSFEHFENEKKRGEAERSEGGSVYKNIVTKKRKLLMIMEHNKKKKRVVAFVISFFYLMLLSLFFF